MITAQAVADAAASYEGVKWRHQGRDRNGIDCLGLLVMVAIDLGIEGAEKFVRYDFRNYGRLPPNRLAQELISAGMLRAQPGIGRVGLFAQPGTYPSHVAIFGDGEMIHALPSNDRKNPGKVVRHGYTAHWPSQFRGAFAFPGVDYGA
jgi:cell wall-associated NlpC family hydrolase